MVNAPPATYAPSTHTHTRTRTRIHARSAPSVEQVMSSSDLSPIQDLLDTLTFSKFQQVGLRVRVRVGLKVRA